MHELELEGADDRGRFLQAQVRLEPVGQYVVVFRPPVRGFRLPGDGQHVGLDRLIGDAVEGEQVGQIPVLDGYPAMFHPADLRARRPDLVSRLFGRHARVLPELAQLTAQYYAQYRRTAQFASAADRRTHAHPASCPERGRHPFLSPMALRIVCKKLRRTRNPARSAKSWQGVTCCLSCMFPYCRKRGQRDVLEGPTSPGCTVQMNVHLPFS